MYLHLRKMILYMISRKFKPNDFITKKKNKSQKIHFAYRLVRYNYENGR